MLKNVFSNSFPNLTNYHFYTLLLSAYNFLLSLSYHFHHSYKGEFKTRFFIWRKLDDIINITRLIQLHLTALNYYFRDNHCYHNGKTQYCYYNIVTTMVCASIIILLVIITPPILLIIINQLYTATCTITTIKIIINSWRHSSISNHQHC